MGNMQKLQQRSKVMVKAFFSILRIFRWHRRRRVSVSIEAISNGSTLTFFPNAHDFIINYPTVHYVSGDRDTISPAMKSLSEHITPGAEFDSSIRDPPPRCHPGTRVALNDRIGQWFSDQGRQKSLLWLNGPAGVGKSAIVQTFAETLASFKCLGASFFFSKPNNRRDPQRVFITVAFRLAIRIPSYRVYLAEQVTLDPSLLQKGMKEQFRVFISEPFGVQGLGNEVHPWGVLLDGLNECEGVDHQCEIVRLISEFVLKFPQAHLVWVIASRPEPHLTATFMDEAVASSHLAEYVSIDSNEACQDVECYLRARFKTIRKHFPHILPTWPSERQFLKIANGASGLFIFATTAIRFIENSDYADPVSRLNLILTVIDRAARARVVVTNDHPFALLDALYAEILISIPAPLWDTTKRILGFALCSRGIHLSSAAIFRLKSRNLVAASTVLELEQSVVYASLHKLHSVLRIPQQKHAHKFGASFLHASFADYLTDPIRSKELFINLEESTDDIIQRLHSIYLHKPWTNNEKSTLQLSGKANKDFYRNLKLDAEAALYCVITGDHKSAQGRGPFISLEDRSKCLDVLAQTNTIELFSNGYHPENFIEWLFKLWNGFRGELEDRDLVRFVRLQDLEFDHLDHQRNKPFLIFSGGITEHLSPNSPEAVQKFVVELEDFRRRSPKTRVLICGATPEKRSAFFYHTFKDWGNHWTEASYCIPQHH